VPLQRIAAAFALHYPNMPTRGVIERDADFQADVLRETAGR
jgi:hypothetical protein